jgi:hypothetical protein
MYLTWDPSTWARTSGCPLYVSQNKSLIAIGQNKASYQSLVLTGDREKSSGQYVNNRSHGQNLRSTQLNAEPIAQYFFKNSTADGELVTV